MPRPAHPLRSCLLWGVRTVGALGRWLIGTSLRRRLLAAFVIAAVLYPLLSGETSPSRIDDACRIFDEKPGWHADLRASAKRWGFPVSLQMAILRQESSFSAKARPPRRKIWGVFPGPRQSSAYGYGQVIDATWNDFRQRRGYAAARRDRFSDVAHFMGWYLHHIHSTTGIAKDDAYALYLAYHEGPGGYQRRSFLEKPWLITVAQDVATQHRRFAEQLETCDRSLIWQRRWSQFFLVVMLITVGTWSWRRMRRLDSA